MISHESDGGLLARLKASGGHGRTQEEIRAPIDAVIDKRDHPEKYPGREGVDFHDATYVHPGTGRRRRHKGR
jgi:hypothetical protein